MGTFVDRKPDRGDGFASAHLLPPTFRFPPPFARLNRIRPSPGRIAFAMNWKSEIAHQVAFVVALISGMLLGFPDGEPAAAEDEFEHFSVDVMTVLSKAGCNLGTCHGNLNGKGGLKLSLRGQDPEFDFHSLAYAARGRRINIAAPQQSLMLQKATGSIPHGGGARFTDESPFYEVIRQWLRSGAPGPSENAPQLTDLDVTPLSAIVRAPDDRIGVSVTASFSDGTTRDVTSQACYELSNLKAEVSEDGVVRRRQFGETTLIVRYLQKQVPVTLAFIEARPDFRWDDPAPFNEVDAHVFAKLKRLRMNPSPLSEDSVFVRRAYLDAIGRAPHSSGSENICRRFGSGQTITPGR
jgi:hypothetical protein